MANVSAPYKTVRTNVNLPIQLRDRIDKYACDKGLPVTQAMIMLLYQGLDAIDNIDKLVKFVNVAKELSDKKSDRVA